MTIIRNIPVIYYFPLALLIGQTCFAQVNDDGTHEQWEYALERTGDVLQIALPLSAGLATFIKEDWEGSKQFIFSYASSMAVTHSLKRIINKKRPEGRHQFDAFPSGHTASAFSGASFIQRRYGWKYGKWAYGLAAIVGISRIEGPNGWHDYWDVLAGAVVGVGNTYIFTTPYEEKRINVGFSSGNGNYILTFRYHF